MEMEKQNKEDDTAMPPPAPRGGGGPAPFKAPSAIAKPKGRPPVPAKPVHPKSDDDDAPTVVVDDATPAIDAEASTPAPAATDRSRSPAAGAGVEKKKKQDDEEEEDEEDDDAAPQRQPAEPAAAAAPRAPGEYEVPTWAGPPKHGYALEVIKGGIEVERIELGTKDHYVIGRTEGLCDIVMLHPSMSRRHAVIQHRATRADGDGNAADDGDDDDDLNKEESGGVFLYDLGSTHGTFVGKKRVPARQFCNIRVGDVLRFGASTRLFVLTARDQEAVRQEEERRLVRRKRLAEQRRRYPEHYRQRMMAGEGKESDERVDDGCAWGMGDDAEEELEEEMNRMDRDAEKGDDDDDDIDLAESSLFMGSTRDAKDFMKKHREEERRRKLLKMQGRKPKKSSEESGAITPKKKKRADEYDKEEEAKMREEEKLKLAVIEEWDQSFDDADDFYDRAGRTSRANAPRHVETVDSLKAKLAVMLGQKEVVASEIEEMEKKITSGVKDEEDELENYMRGLSTDMDKKGLKKKQDLLKSLNDEITRVERLIEIAQPAIDRVGGKGTKKMAGIAADVERIKQEYLSRVRRDKSRETKKKELAKRKLEEIKEREKREEEERKVSSATVLQGDIAPAEAEEQQASNKRTAEEMDSEEEEAAAEERKAEDEYVMSTEAEAERRRARNRKKREKRREREREQKKQKFDDEAVMDEEHQEQGYGYSEWVPPSSAKHYSL